MEFNWDSLVLFNIFVDLSKEIISKRFKSKHTAISDFYTNHSKRVNTPFYAKSYNATWKS